MKCIQAYWKVSFVLHKQILLMKAVWQDLFIGESGAKWHTYLPASTNMTTWKVSHKYGEEVLISALVFKRRKQSICFMWNFFYYCGKFWFTQTLNLKPTDDAILKWIRYIKTFQTYPYNTKQRTRGGERQQRNRLNKISYSFKQSPPAI